MSRSLHDELLEATRLTRAGQPLAATAHIQRALHGGATPKPGHPSGRSPAAFATPTATTIPTGLMDLMAHLPRGCSTPDSRASARWLGWSPRAQGVVGQVPHGARFETATYTSAAGSLDYKVYVPTSYRGSPVPLVVMLHGCTQDPGDFAAGTQMNELAEAHDCLIAYPAQRPEANPSRCWNWFRKSDQARGQGEPSLIAGITHQVQSDYAVDPHRIYLAGMSAGGAMATIMAATYPDLYAAVGVHSGLAHAAARDLPSALRAMSQSTAAGPTGGDGTAVPTIVFHGDRDAVVHPDNGVRIVEDAVARASAHGEPEVSSTYCGDSSGDHHHTRTTYRDRRGRAMVEHWVIHGAGHAWSGGSHDGSYSDPSGPDASAEMLRFFFEHGGQSR